MSAMLARAAIWVAVLPLLAPGAEPAHSKEAERLFNLAVLSENRGDYWQALRDAEAALRADPAWAEAQRLRRTAGYEAHYREALRLMDTGDWKQAEDQLENARVYGNTAELSAKLRLARTHLRRPVAPRAADERFETAIPAASNAAAMASLNDYLNSVRQALAARDWSLVEQRIRHIPTAQEPAAQDDLLPALRLYAGGQASQARAAAKALATRQSDAAAQSFLIFLNFRARHEKLSAVLVLITGMYAAALLLSLYCGLRREVRAA